MPGQREDLVGLFDHVWDRFLRRMDGLDDEEWRWAPTAEAALLRDLFASRPLSPPGHPSPAAEARRTR
jgi:hypothetical protein